jgi:hypothetical protein
MFKIKRKKKNEKSKGNEKQEENSKTKKSEEKNEKRKNHVKKLTSAALNWPAQRRTHADGAEFRPANGRSIGFPVCDSVKG